MGTRPEDPTSLVGELIGRRYRVRKVLGRGGSGIVLAAEDQGANGEIVALKLSHGTRQEDRERLTQEYRILSRMTHPHLVSAEGFGIDPSTNRAYLVMELVEGKDLYEACREAPLEDVADRVAQLVRALGLIHDRGLVHLDVKPENVTVTP